MTVSIQDPIKSRRGEPAFSIERAFRDGVYRSICTARCAKCQNLEEFKWDHGNNPIPIKKRFLEKGWLFDPYNKKSCICPDCKKRGWVMAMPEKKAEDKVVAIKPSGKDAQPAPPRALTPEERGKVRSLLDSHFDDAVGRYIDGYSDQRIGTELDIPWSRVREIRELAYGPIKEDPRLAALSADLAECKDTLSKLEKKIDELRREHAAA
jgi:hypothetical protein